MHALIIEDQSLIAMTLEDELSELGFTSFDFATSEEEAIAAAKTRCPDFITADDRLTTGSGIEAVRIICAEQSIPTVYIVGNPHELRDRLPNTIVIGSRLGGMSFGRPFSGLHRRWWLRGHRKMPDRDQHVPQRHPMERKKADRIANP